MNFIAEAYNVYAVRNNKKISYNVKNKNKRSILNPMNIKKTALVYRMLNILRKRFMYRQWWLVFCGCSFDFPMFIYIYCKRKKLFSKINNQKQTL